MDVRMRVAIVECKLRISEAVGMTKETCPQGKWRQEKPQDLSRKETNILNLLFKFQKLVRPRAQGRISSQNKTSVSSLSFFM